MSTRLFRPFFFLMAFSAIAGGCAPAEDPDEDLGAISDDKADAPSIQQTVTLPAATASGPGTLHKKVKSTVDFRTALSATSKLDARIRVRALGNETASPRGDVPSLVEPAIAAASTYDLYLENYATTKVTAKLSVQGVQQGLAPKLSVRFTIPQCAALPDKGVPAGAHCSSDLSGLSNLINTSRAAAGITPNLLEWLDGARQFKVDHPDRDVKITMAYLTWSDAAYYDSICKATQAGVKFEGYFDQATAGNQPPRLAMDASCKQENISIKYAGGKTDASWQLMHIKMIMIDDGEPTTRLVFSSANLSSFATSLHFENWVFGEYPTQSHFIESHKCAAAALSKDAYDAQGNSPQIFQQEYEGCVAGLAAKGLTEDPHYRVFFTPNAQRSSVNAAMREMAAAKSQVLMAIQHFDDWELGQALAATGTLPDARLIVDDDTFYGNGEGSAGGDQSLYNQLIKPSGVKTHFMETTDALHQYQHNKYIIVDKQKVFCGAGNYSGAAFADNYENFYLFDDASFAKLYGDHFERMYGISVSEDKLPADYNY